MIDHVHLFQHDIKGVLVVLLERDVFPELYGKSAVSRQSSLRVIVSTCLDKCFRLDKFTDRHAERVVSTQIFLSTDLDTTFSEQRLTIIFCDAESHMIFHEIILIMMEIVVVMIGAVLCTIRSCSSLRGGSTSQRSRSREFSRWFSREVFS